MGNNTLDIFNGPILVINVGVQDFGETLEQQDVVVIYVEWTPPAGGDHDMINLLDALL